jgi:glycerol kinase
MPGAAIVGMTAHTNRNHIIRAALESIAYQIRDVLEAMKSRAGIDLKIIHADGGATRNRFLMQFIADITGWKSPSPGSGLFSLGAAMAGALGMGIYASLDELARLPHEAITYRPQMHADDVTNLVAGWKRAVAQVLHAS